MDQDVTARDLTVCKVCMHRRAGWQACSKDYLPCSVFQATLCPCSSHHLFKRCHLHQLYVWQRQACRTICDSLACGALRVAWGSKLHNIPTVRLCNVHCWPNSACPGQHQHCTAIFTPMLECCCPAPPLEGHTEIINFVLLVHCQDCIMMGCIPVLRH